MRFNLQAMLLIVLVVAMYFGVWALPVRPSLIALAFITLASVPVSVAGAFYGKGNVQAFFLGAAIVMGWTAVMVGGLDALTVSPSLNSSWYGGEIQNQRLVHTYHQIAAIVSGLLVVVVRSILVRRQAPASSNDE